MRRRAICYSGHPSVVRKWQACVLDEADCSCLLVNISVCVHVCVYVRRIHVRLRVCVHVYYSNTYILFSIQYQYLVGSGLDA